MRRLILSGQNFPQILAGSFHIFPNLHYLDLSASNVASIDENAFTENKNLDTLVLNRNSLATIPSLFDSNENSLKSLIVNHNNLEMVDSTHLTNLLFLSLENNLLIESYVAQTLSNLPKLYHLNLDSNEIASVEKSTFSNQNELEFLSLWDNQIARIKPGSFDHITTLEYLNLKDNVDLVEYRTEAWHFCHNIEREILHVDMESNKTIPKDLKVDPSTDMYCINNPSNNVEASCTNDNGHLTCQGDIENLVCELKDLDFKSITFSFPKDKSESQVDKNFGAAVNDPYFQDINGKDNMTKYLTNLKLYGTLFDLATLEDYVGLRTENVTIFADTIWMSRSLTTPIKSRISMRARVVSISEDIPMNMTKQQLFNQNLAWLADQPVDNWASVEEVVTNIGNSSFSIRKQGFIEIQKAHVLEPLRSLDSRQCSPRYFNVTEYEQDHNTPPAVFFDRVQLNLLRVAVRTLASTKSNDNLALDIADHTLSKTADASIVEDKKAYLVAQKFIGDKELITSNSRNVPFYSTSAILKQVENMVKQMNTYKDNEDVLMIQLSLALGRMTDMNQHFEAARIDRELYFQLELKQLEIVFNNTDNIWKGNFEESRGMNENIQKALAENHEQMMQMKENELIEMLARAEDTVRNDQAVVDKFNAEITRYSNEATLSMGLQKQKLKELVEAGEVLEEAQKKLESDLEEWKRKQMMKALFSFFTAYAGLIVGIATMQPEIAVGAAAEAGMGMEEVFSDVGAIITALKGIKDITDTIAGMGDGSVDVPDISGDMSVYIATSWRSALENSYTMKNMASTFNDIRIAGETEIDDIGIVTEYAVDPAPMKEAMFTYTDRGTQLIAETTNFAGLMMHLADVSGDLEVAELDLQMAIEDVNRVQQMLANLTAEHDRYIEDMDQRRKEYEDKTDEYEDAYESASNQTRQDFEKQITDLFKLFEETFEESNKQYISQMNDLTASLYAKVASVTQHSMVQRSAIMNLYQDYCDALFFFSFTDCNGEPDPEAQNGQSAAIPTMSDDFNTLIIKLEAIDWSIITSVQNFGNLAEEFHKVNMSQLFSIIIYKYSL